MGPLVHNTFCVTVQISPHLFFNDNNLFGGSIGIGKVNTLLAILGNGDARHTPDPLCRTGWR